jgi:hypothetical protein
MGKPSEEIQLSHPRKKLRYHLRVEGSSVIETCIDEREGSENEERYYESSPEKAQEKLAELVEVFEISGFRIC